MAVAMATAPAPPHSICRYPKRKRAAVSYNENDVPDDDLLFFDEAIDGEVEARENKKPKAAKREPRQKPFPFLSLPPELRNKIYREALGGRNGVYICNARRGLRRSCEGTTDVKSWATPAANLLATCQAVDAEAAAMLYGQRFRFADNRALLTFMTLLRPSTAAQLRDVAVADWNSGRTFSSMNVPAMALLSHCGGGLRSLRVETELLRAQYYRSSYTNDRGRSIQRLLAHKVYRDCYPLLYAVEAQRGLAAVLEVVQLADVNYIGLLGSRRDAGDKQWTEPADGQASSDADKVAARRRLFQMELGRLLGWDDAAVEAVWESWDARVGA